MCFLLLYDAASAVTIKHNLNLCLPKPELQLQLAELVGNSLPGSKLIQLHTLINWDKQPALDCESSNEDRRYHPHII